MPLKGHGLVSPKSVFAQNPFKLNYLLFSFEFYLCFYLLYCNRLTSCLYFTISVHWWSFESKLL